VNISNWLHDNLRALAGAAARTLRVDVEEVEAMIEELEIDRFGLNYDFIEAQGLTWIDNLETGSGGDLASPRHPDHFKPYVQDYLRRYGSRKCEANALVVRPEAGRKLCADWINRYVTAEDVAAFEESLKEERQEFADALAERFNLD
jgi:hypothetical protein